MSQDIPFHNTQNLIILRVRKLQILLFANEICNRKQIERIYKSCSGRISFAAAVALLLNLSREKPLFANCLFTGFISRHFGPTSKLKSEESFRKWGQISDLFLLKNAPPLKSDSRHICQVSSSLRAKMTGSWRRQNVEPARTPPSSSGLS